MDQLIEFAGNHPMLSMGFVMVVLALIWSEISRQTQGFSELAPAQAVPLINRDNTVVLDVSASADFGKGHIVGARHVPPSRLDKPDPEIQKLIKSPVLVVCKVGQAAPAAAGKLIKMGASEVSVLKGGMAAWTADKYPITRK